MALLESTGHVRKLTQREWDDYASLKKAHWHRKYEEIIFNGFDLSAGAVAEFNAAADLTIAHLSAEAQVYIKSQTDLEALDGDSIYIDYLDDDGILHENVETLLDDATGTDEEMPLGNENIKDTVAAVDGITVTLTALNGGEDGYNGKYMVVYSGDQKGTNSLIVDTSDDDPSVLTVADEQNANLAGDLISIQSDPYEDFYRIRSMTSETEALTDNAIVLCDHNGGNLYCAINDANTQAAPCRYFVPAITSGKNTDYYLGYIKARGTIINEGDGTATGFIVQVRYTPKALNSNVPAADILQSFEFNEFLHWEPCIELEPATDVIFYIGDNGLAGEIHLEYAILEVDRI